MFGIDESCPTRDSDISELLNAWLDSQASEQGKSDRTKLSASETASAYNKISANLYEHLSVIDSKASALIASNAIITAILLGLMLNLEKTNGAPERIQLFFIFLAILLVLSIISVIANLSVLGIVWSNANDFHQKGKEVSDQARLILRTRSNRTIRLRISLLLHITVVVLSFVVFFAYIFFYI